MRIASRRSLLMETSTIDGGLLALNGSSIGANSTGGFFVDADNEEGGLSERQLLAIALLATLIPLILIVLIVLSYRFVWRKFQPSSDDGGARLRRTDSSEPNAAKSAASIGHLLPEELKGSESQSTVTPSVDELNETPKSPLLGSSHRPAMSGPPSVAAQPICHHQASAKSANGSIITLTMQNNHLIVETETTGDLDALTATSSDAVSTDSVMLEGGGVCEEQAAQIHVAPPSPPSFTGLSVSANSLNQPPSYCYSTQTAYGVTPLCQPITRPLQELRIGGGAADDSSHISAKILRRRLHSAHSQAMDDADFAPNHHRTASLPPIKLTRTNTMAESRAPPEPPAVVSVAPRGIGKFKARASLPCINVPLLSRLTGMSSSSNSEKPAPIAE